MTESPGASIQTLTDGRLTLKQAHIEWLGWKPDDKDRKVDVSFGPADSILIHHPDRRRKLVRDLLGERKLALDSDQNAIELRLDSVAKTVPVDEQGRMRVPEEHLRFARLTDKSCRVYVVPRGSNEWLEIWEESKFEDYVRDPSDGWMATLTRVLQSRQGTPSIPTQT